MVSSGDAPPPDAVISVADELSEEFDTCLYDRTSCTGLAATTNVEAAQAKRVGATFVHLELVREIRDDEELRREAIQSAVGALLAEDQGDPDGAAPSCGRGQLSRRAGPLPTDA